MHKTVDELVSKRSHPPFELGSDAAAKRPELAVHVATLFALSADLERSKAAIFLNLIRGEPFAGRAVFMRLRSAQAHALNAAVKEKLPSHTKLFQKVLDAGEPFEDVRNRFAHWSWCVVEELPNHICLMDPRSVTESDALFNSLYPDPDGPRKETPELKKRIDQRTKNIKKQVYAYDKEALNKAAEVGYWLYDLLDEFFHLTEARRKDQVRRAVSELDALLQRGPK